MNKQFYFKQLSFGVNKVEWFQVLICITNNSIKHQSFAYTQLSDKQFYFKQPSFACQQSWMVPSIDMSH